MEMNNTSDTVDRTIQLDDSKENLTWMIKGTIDDKVSQFFDVPGSDGHPVGQVFCENVRNSDLVDRDVRVRRNDSSAREVDSLSHHVHSKQTLGNKYFRKNKKLRKQMRII